EDSGFAVLRLQPSGKSYLVTVVGRLAAAHVGESVRLHGRWTTHPQHGRQFEAQDCAVVLPTTVEGIRKYLGSGLIRGVGPVTAERLVRHFGVDTLEVIEHAPGRLEEAGGIGPTRARAIRAAWQEQKAIKEVMLFLAAHDVSTTLGLNIYRQYGDDSVRVVRGPPYRLARAGRGIGFKPADKIATKLGIPPDSPDRAMAALSHVLSQAADDGHTYLPEQELLARGGEMLDRPADGLGEALAALEAEGAVEIEPRIESDSLGPAVYLRPFARAEQGLAGRLRGLMYNGQDRLRPRADAGFDRAFAWPRQSAGLPPPPAPA